MKGSPDNRRDSSRINSWSTREHKKMKESLEEPQIDKQEESRDQFGMHGKSKKLQTSIPEIRNSPVDRGEPGWGDVEGRII